MTTDAAPPPPPPTGAAPHTIDLSDLVEGDAWLGQTITIRPHMSYASSTRIETARIQMQTTISPQARRSPDSDMEMVTAVTPLDYAAAVVEECVTAWTLTGLDGEPLAANASGVRSPQAPAELLDVAIDEIMAYYDARKPKLRQRSGRRTG